MERQARLQAMLSAITPHVYFQPPVDIEIQYPCIVYQLDGMPSDHANNGRYRFAMRFTVTLIDWEPDSDLFEKVADLPYTAFDRFYAADDLNHFVFTTHV